MLAIRSDLIMTNTTVSSNEADDGGGVYCGTNCELWMYDSELADNIVAKSGGALALQLGTAALHETILVANTAGFVGGAIYGDGPLSLASCTISHSSAPLVGSAIFAAGDCAISNSTVEFTLGDTPVVGALKPVTWSGGELSCNGVLSVYGSAAENIDFADDVVVRNNYIFDDDVYTSASLFAATGSWVRGGDGPEDPRECAGAPVLCDAFTCYNDGSCVEADSFTGTPTCDCGTTNPGPDGGVYVGRLCNEICGNGAVEGDEPCDDGNTDGGDGCSSACDNVAFGYTCGAEGGKCESTCGDGKKARDETCDDVDDPKCVSCEFVGSRILNDWEAAVTALVPLAVFGIIAATCAYLDSRYPGTRHMDLLWMVCLVWEWGECGCC